MTEKEPLNPAFGPGWEAYTFLHDVLPSLEYRWRGASVHDLGWGSAWVGCDWLYGSPGILVTVAEDGAVSYAPADARRKPTGPAVALWEAVAEVACGIEAVRSDLYTERRIRRLQGREEPVIDLTDTYDPADYEPGGRMDF